MNNTVATIRRLFGAQSKYHGIMAHDAWSDEDSRKHPRGKGGKFTRKSEGGPATVAGEAKEAKPKKKNQPKAAASAEPSGDNPVKMEDSIKAKQKKSMLAKEFISSIVVEAEKKGLAVGKPSSMAKLIESFRKNSSLKKLDVIADIVIARAAKIKAAKAVKRKVESTRTEAAPKVEKFQTPAKSKPPVKPKVEKAEKPKASPTTGQEMLRHQMAEVLEGVSRAQNSAREAMSGNPTDKRAGAVQRYAGAVNSAILELHKTASSVGRNRPEAERAALQSAAKKEAGVIALRLKRELQDVTSGYQRFDEAPSWLIKSRSVPHRI
jgi:hypothetical protein